VPEVPWTAVRVRPSVPDVPVRSALMQAFFDAGAQGLHEDGEQLVTHFPPGTDLEQVQRVLMAADPDVIIDIADVPPIDWSESWKTGLDAHQVGELVVTPPWLADQYDAARTIVIDPGMAFGTGEHATTRGVMRLLGGVLRRGDTVADLGAGSAVLAIAAAKLGASRVYAIELDEEAIPNAHANVERNGVADIVHVFQGGAEGLLPLVAPVRVVLANIISSVLEELLPTIADSIVAGGAVILSGILQEERAHMLEVLGASGWQITAEDAEDIWWSVAIARG
jgi:ribosomal protein L11 methyltransferase